MMENKDSDEIRQKNLDSKLVGAVMVVGGGIAGIQAALDSADQGFKVYLVEKKSAIGGHMAQLDKTFPTNDCAMCNISPKLVDAGRHLNIDIFTNTEVMDVEGEAGDFTVTLHRKPRFIDTTKCVSCGKCAEVCPVSLPDLYEEELKERKAAYRLYTQAIPSAYVIEKAGTAPCRDACPAGQRAQGYIALISEGRYREALRVIKEDNPFPSVCGRTCHRPCENSCTRGIADEPVNIMGLKRFVVDYALAYGREKVEPVARTRPEWVAIVGAGPAGLTAAHDLVKMGYGVTIYEALPVAGGMMRVGIPAHRLPKGVLQQDIDDILALGVVLKTNSPIKDPTQLLKQGYNAVCLATGISQNEHSLGLEGEDAQGVLSAATFLRKVNLGEPVSIGDRVAVVGGGITALDAAAVARRLGAKEVHLVLDRPRGELPAYHWEVNAIESEGIYIYDRTTATRILTESGTVSGIELAETTKGMSRDKSGRRRPNIKPGTEQIFEVDTVIGTVGQFSDLNYLAPRFEDMSVNAKTLASEIPGMFMVGGRKTGASYIIEAISLGHKVAKSIHHYLQGESLSQSGTTPPVAKFARDEIKQKVMRGEIKIQPKNDPALLPIEERVTSFREVVLGLTELQARAEAKRCLQCGICSECMACDYVCEVDAIDHSMVELDEKVNVGAIILAPGYQVYHSELSEEFGFGRYPNVVTALQFERLLSASGPTMGHVKRPSDGKTPQRIAFIQCVGSRDQSHDYCSAVCCMYATKEAIVAKEHHPDMDIHVFMMEMRAFSKGYWDYYKRARENFGVHYHRNRISSVKENPHTRSLILQYTNGDGGFRARELENQTNVFPNLIEEEFDLVVLSVGMEISSSVRELGNRMGIELDEYGFCRTVQFNPVETSRSGIYAIGPFREPKDIPESVVEASGAVAASASLLSDVRWSQTQEAEYPPERDVLSETPRIGVFVCHCGSNIGGFLDVPGVAEYADRLSNVVYNEHLLYACSQDSIELITQKVKENNLNRVVVASCSPLTHAALFQDSIRMAGLNPYLFEMANIRNQCSWVHSNDWDVATKKAKELVRMAVARAEFLEPQHTFKIPINQAVLIVGGGAAGMVAAISLARQGYPVHLVDKDLKLGGNLRKIYTFTHDDNEARNPKRVLKQLIKQVSSNEKINIHIQSQILSSRGFLGNYTSVIEHLDGSRTEIEHGATILATGAQEYRGPEYHYGSDPRIITLQEFEVLLGGLKSIKDLGEEENVAGNESSRLPGSVVMIQCIGPAEEYCSRICCTVALKNAITLKAMNPEAQVIILYRDIRAYGFKERLYSRAREEGVIFVRYDEDHKPEVEIGGSPNRDLNKISNDLSLRIHTWDPAVEREFVFEPDFLVLSMPVVPNPDAQKLVNLFKVSLDPDGFFQEAHVKLRPVDFSTDGVFMAGMAHYPKLLDETLVQAQAAAARVARVLSRENIEVGGRVAVVDETLCTGCLTCMRVCPFNVPIIKSELTGVGDIQGAAYIEPSICQGCGVCAADCPAQAIQLNHFTDAQMIAKVRALVDPEMKLIPVEEILISS